MILASKDKNTRLFKSNDGQEVAFSYNWAFSRYHAGDNALCIMIDILATDEYDESFVWVDFPELVEMVNTTCKKYGGIISDEDNSLKFHFNDYDMLLEFITTTSRTLKEAGVIASHNISRLPAFPSLEYANEMLQYLFDSPVTLNDIEQHMAICAGLPVGCYTEILFGNFPLTSAEKFDSTTTNNLKYIEKLFDEISIERVYKRCSREIKKSEVSDKPLPQDTVLAGEFWF